MSLEQLLYGNCWNRRALLSRKQYMTEWANQQSFFFPANTVIHKMFKHKYTQHYKKTVTLYCTELQHGAQFSCNQATRWVTQRDLHLSYIQHTPAGTVMQTKFNIYKKYDLRKMGCFELVCKCSHLYFVLKERKHTCTHTKTSPL